MVPMSMGAPPRRSSLARREPGEVCGKITATRPLGKPSVAVGGGGRSAAGDDPRPIWEGGAGGPGGERPPSRGRGAGPRQLGELVGEGAGQCGDGLVGVPSARRELSGEQFVLLGHVPSTHADDEPPPESAVQGRQLLGGAERMAFGQDQDVGEEVGTGSQRGQPAERGHRVVPDRAHGIGQAGGDGGVIAHADVEEAGLVGRLCDLLELRRAGLLLPGRRIERGLGLNGQLHAVDDLPLGDGRTTSSGYGEGDASPTPRPVSTAALYAAPYAVRPSTARSARFMGSPPPYPPIPLLATTRWQGTMMAIGFFPLAWPTARGPRGRPTRRASSP